MPVDFEVTDINSVDEPIRKAYVEKEGKFILDPERYAEIKAEPLHRKNQELLDEKKKLQQSSRALEEKAKSGLTDIEKQMQERDQRIAQLESENREYAIWTPVKTLALQKGVLPDRVEAVMTLLRADKRFDMENGALVFRRNGYVSDIPPDRAFQVYLKEELPWAFEASKAAGSGAQNGRGGAGTRTITRDSFESMSEAAKSQALKDGARIID